MDVGFQTTTDGYMHNTKVKHAEGGLPKTTSDTVWDNDNQVAVYRCMPNYQAQWYASLVYIARSPLEE